jgi:hypothetical protein
MRSTTSSATSEGFARSAVERRPGPGLYGAPAFFVPPLLNRLTAKAQGSIIGLSIRRNAETEAARSAAREELAAGHPMTLRQVHYRLVSRDDVVHPNTKSTYKTLSGCLRDDRLSGEVEWEWMEDRLREPHDMRMWDGLGDYFQEIRRAYRRQVWSTQPRYVEAWCEKDALSSIFAEEVDRYRVTLNIGRGYDGWSSIKEAAERYRYWEVVHGLQTTVLYFGDFDPSGEDMHRSLQERFAQLGVYPDMSKLALTHADTQRLPFNFTKVTDSRAPAFIEKYGNLAVELDALPAEELRERIRSGFGRSMDLRALQRALDTETTETARFNEALDAVLGEL